MEAEGPLAHLDDTRITRGMLARASAVDERRVVEHGHNGAPAMLGLVQALQWVH